MKSFEGGNIVQKMTEAEKEISVLLSHLRDWEIDLEYHKQHVEKLEKKITECRKKITKLID